MTYAPDPTDRDQGILRLRAAAWEGFGAVNIARRAGQHRVAHDAVALALPLVHLPGARIRIDGMRAQHTDSRRGTHCVIPGGASMSGAWSCRTDYLILKFEDGFLAMLAERGEHLPAPGDVAPRAGIDDPVVFQLGLLLKDELDNGGARGRLYREALGVAIAAAALGPAPGGPEATGRGEPHRLRLAVEFLNDNLHADIAVGELAAAAHLSPRQLTRAFQGAFGMAPHQYLVAQRIERAKLMLRDPALPLTEIALRCGFKTASHFTRVFRTMVGLAPGAYRLAHGPTRTHRQSIG